jgi:hypothetical protein
LLPFRRKKNSNSICMECPICKEHIKEGAKKCPVCGEVLASGKRLQKWAAGFLSASFSVTVALASLGFAYLEYQGRVQAEEGREAAEAQKEVAEYVLKKVPSENLSAAVKEVQVELNEEFRKNPQNPLVQQRLFYTETFLKQ